MNLLMSRPEHYGIFYEINSWMNIDNPVNQAKAEVQWQKLYETLLGLQVTIQLVEQVSGLPDMVFTANAGLVYHNQVLISTFKNKERQPESIYFERWFREQGFDIVTGDPELSFEGAGDALFFNRYLVTAFGFRSDKKSYEAPFFKQFNLVFCALVNPYFYHLDTCFCPLNEELALWYPAAFSTEAQALMQQMGQLIAVPEAEAKRFACNSVVVGNQVVLPSDCPKTCQLLEEHGFVTYSCDMDEYIKSGGACKCLVLRVS